MESKTLYKKYTLKEVKPIIEDLVRKSITYDELMDKERKDWHEKHPQYDWLGMDETSNKLREEERELSKKWFHNPYREELYNLTHYHTPIKNSKKCCRNCAFAICHLRDDNWHYCKDYKPDSWREIVYIKPFFNKNNTSPTLEQRVNNSTKSYLEDYKKVLKKCSELENDIPKNIVTKPFSQAALNKEDQFQKEQKQYWDEFGATFDKKETKLKGDGPFAGMTLYSAKPNKERQKAFFEKWNKCPIGAMAEGMGLIKEKEDDKA